MSAYDMKKQLITHEELKKRLAYDSESGKFYWISDAGRGHKIVVGAEAGFPNKRGYKLIVIGVNVYYAHRLAWFFIHGKWPRRLIDHINGVKNDNRLSNLREVTAAQNVQNKHVHHATNKTGMLGVWITPGGKKWRSGICINGKAVHLGTFNSPEEAQAAYFKAKAKHHPFGEIAKTIN